MDDKKLVIKAYGASNIGKVRQENQDSFYMNGVYAHRANENDSFELTESADKPQVYAVFDGLGGEEGGELSSRTACEVMGTFQEKLTEATTEDMLEVYCDFATVANRKICKALGSVYYPKGGTTFVSVQLSNGVIHPFYLGDSRIYFGYKDKENNEMFYILSQDHTVAMEKVKKGEMKIEDVPGSRENHMLTKFLGDNPFLGYVKASDCAYIKMEPGMVILLCSDGLHDMVPGHAIYQTIMYAEDPAKELVEMALANGGYDNVTPVVIRIEEE